MTLIPISAGRYPNVVRGRRRTGGVQNFDLRRSREILDFLIGDRGPEAGDPLPAFGHAGPVAGHPIRFGRRRTPAGADPDVTVAARVPGPIARHPDVLATQRLLVRRDLLNLGRRLVRHHQARLNLQIDGFGKGLVYGTAGENLGLFLLRRRRRLVRTLCIERTGGPNKQHQHRDGKSHLSFSNTMNLSPPSPFIKA